jgi:hypothetical protein
VSDPSDISSRAAAIAAQSPRAWIAASVTVRLYEGTKHTMATDAVRRGVSERALQRFLGHADLRSTRRYAKMADEALVTVLRPVVGSTEDEDLSRTCPADFPEPSNTLNFKKKVGVPNGTRTRVGFA